MHQMELKLSPVGNQVNIREQRQEEAAYSFKRQGILKCAPRFGKIRTSIKILNRDQPKKILIAFPRTTIKDSWVNDFKIWNYEHNDITFTTFKSLHKYVDDKNIDFVIFDEIHEASRNQLTEMRKFVKRNIQVLGLSGTLTDKSEKEIYYYADLVTLYSYSIEQAVQEGILCDYQIYIHKVPLYTQPTGKYTDKYKKPVSEKKKFDGYSWVMDQYKKGTSSYFQMELKIIALIQNSESKRIVTKKLLTKFANERILVFCGTTEIADSLDIPTYHSKAKEKQMFIDFCEGKGNHLATIKMAQAGVTIKPIHKGIINYTSGNPEDSAQKICRFLGLEYDTPDKKAEVHIIISDEKFEIGRINSALMFFDHKKIKYIN